MSDENKLMSIPHKTLRMDDERVGLKASQITVWQATHPDPTYADIPTSQDVADGVVDVAGVAGVDVDVDPVSGLIDEDDTDSGLIVVTEEQRLRRLLSSFAKTIWEYFCQGSHAKK